MMKHFTFIENSVEGDYFPLSLDAETLLSEGVDPSNHEDLNHYISKKASLHHSKFGVGGYLEKRNLYQNSSLFNAEEIRNIHLGIDVWAPEGSRIASPLAGEVVVSYYNEGEGNYGGTIILKHSLKTASFFTLFGHLSKASLGENPIGKIIPKDLAFCSLGNPSENGGYVPHLHYQIVLDMLDYEKDFPGVCSEKQLEYLSKISPNPTAFLNNSIV